MLKGEEHHTLNALSYCAFFAQFFGYFILSGLIEVWFYRKQSQQERSWKIQPNGRNKWPGIKQSHKNNSFFVLSIPLLDFFFSSAAATTASTTQRHSKHKTFATLNLVVSSLFALVVSYRAHRAGKIELERIHDYEYRYERV